MVKRGRFVFDTNVIISALLIKTSVARLALDKGRERGNILLSLETIEELHDTLGRPAFDHYIDKEDRIKFATLLIREAILVDITEHVVECRDPKDNKFLELAASGNADVIVSGDEDLQVLNPFRKILILSPREFLESDP
jgi:putative PIN family toxin of toxin-antitoxin system